jgi:hypothetical protein
MHVHAFDKGALSGNFFDMSSIITAISIPMITFTLKPQLFYFDFEGDVEGLFASMTLRAELQKIPISFSYQAVPSIWTKFQGNEFKWNAGLTYYFSF